jgi:hypothetical protein
VSTTWGSWNEAARPEGWKEARLEGQECEPECNAECYEVGNVLWNVVRVGMEIEYPTALGLDLALAASIAVILRISTCFNLSMPITYHGS